jgi:hypothetical protein
MLYPRDANSAAPPLVEQVPATFLLAVRGIEDLVPWRGRPVGVGLPLGHDTLQVQPLHRFEQREAVLLHHHCLEHVGAFVGEYGVEMRLPLGERERAKVAPVQPEDVKRREGETALPAQQVHEHRAPLGIEGEYFSVQDGGACGHQFTERTAECAEPLEPVAALRVDGALIGREVGETTEAVVLGLEHPSAVVERGGPLDRDDRLNVGKDGRLRTAERSLA